MSQSRPSTSPWACPGDLLEDLASRYIAVRAETNPNGQGVRIVVSDTLDQLTQADIAAIAYWGPEIFAIVEEWDQPEPGKPAATAEFKRGKAGKLYLSWSWDGTHREGRVTETGIQP